MCPHATEANHDESSHATGQIEGIALCFLLCLPSFLVMYPLRLGGWAPREDKPQEAERRGALTCQAGGQPLWQGLPGVVIGGTAC